MGARVPAREPGERLLHLLQEGIRQAAGRHGAERVPIQAGVLGRDPALLAPDPHPDGAALLLQLAEHAPGGHGLEAASLRFVLGQVTHRAQHVVEPVRVRGAGAVAEPLQVRLDLVQRRRVDQVAELLLAEQLPEQVAIEGQRGRAALGVGRVTLVHVGGHVVEEERRGERRGALGLGLHQRELAGVQAAEQLLEAGKVEHVAQALAVGLEHDRELAVALRDLEQRLRLQPLLPERRAPARVGAREQEGTRGVLAEARAEQRRSGQLAHHELLERVGLDHHELRRRRLVRVGKVDDDAVVRPDRVGLEAEVVTDPRGQRQRPRRVHAAAEGRQHAQAPIADLVAEALHDHGPVGGHHPRGVALLAQEGREVAGRALVEVVLRRQLQRVAVHRLAREGADRLAELLGAADALALPERHGSRGARRRRDDHAVARDLLDSPGARPEEERLPRTRLVDHLLVQLAHAAAVGKMHAVEPAVGDRARVGHRQLAGAASGPDRVLHAVPDDPGAQLGELLARVTAIEHVEHAVEELARELGEGVGVAHQVVQLRHAPVVPGRHHRHDLLGQHVERVARHHGGLDVAIAHAFHHDRALEEVGPELGEDAPARHLAHAMAGAADALEPGGDGLGRLDLDHQVHGPHVDPELERRGGHDAGQLAGLQEVLHHQPLLAGERPVMSPRDRAPVSPSSPASSLSRTASRSAPRRLFTKMIVDRCSRTSSRSSG